MLNIKGSLGGGRVEARKSFGDGLSLAELVTGVENECRHKHLMREGTSERETDGGEPGRRQSDRPARHLHCWGRNTNSSFTKGLFVNAFSPSLSLLYWPSLSLIPSFSL